MPMYLAGRDLLKTPAVILSLCLILVVALAATLPPVHSSLDVTVTITTGKHGLVYHGHNVPWLVRRGITDLWCYELGFVDPELRREEWIDKRGSLHGLDSDQANKTIEDLLGIADYCAGLKAQVDYDARNPIP